MGRTYVCMYVYVVATLDPDAGGLFTSGHLLSVGRFFSLKRLSSWFFWSKAIILLTASLSFSSCSNVCTHRVRRINLQWTPSTHYSECLLCVCSFHDYSFRALAHSYTSGGTVRAQSCDPSARDLLLLTNTQLAKLLPWLLSITVNQST